MEFTKEDIDLLIYGFTGLVSTLYAAAVILRKASTKSDGLLELIFNVLKDMKGKNIAPMLLVMALVLPSLTGCATFQNKPTQPGEVLAAVESDYTTALIAAKAAYDAGAISVDKAARIDKLRNEIGPMLDRAYAAFSEGSTVEGNEWVKLAVPLVSKLLLEVPQ